LLDCKGTKLTTQNLPIFHILEAYIKKTFFLFYVLHKTYLFFRNSRHIQYGSNNSLYRNNGNSVLHRDSTVNPDGCRNGGRQSQSGDNLEWSTYAMLCRRHARAHTLVPRDVQLCQGLQWGDI